jgi:hypothetical protein
MEPPRRNRRMTGGETPTDPAGIRALMAELARQQDAGALPDQRLIPQLRTAVIERVERTSLRSAAREIGMSPTGLRKFLDGNMPYTKTLHRLRKWYLQHAADSRYDITEEDAFAALRVLVHDLPEPVQAQTIQGMLECMEESYTRSHKDVPAWVAELRERFGPSTA